MNPRAFPNTRGVLSGDETPEAVNMSLDSPESPEEAGAAAGSPSPNPTYNPEEEARMLLDQAETGPLDEPLEVKAESAIYVTPGSSPDYAAPGSSPGSSKGRIPSPFSALYSQVRGTDSLITHASLEDGKKRREEESRRARARTKILDQVRGAVQTTFKDPITPKTTKRRARAESEEGQ